MDTKLEPQMAPSLLSRFGLDVGLCLFHKLVLGLSMFADLNECAGIGIGCDRRIIRKLLPIQNVIESLLQVIDG